VWPSERALPPDTLLTLARQLGHTEAECEPQPARGREGPRRWAAEQGGAVLATGSVYLVGELLAGAARPPAAAPQRGAQA
jgi:hypothetical protein